jgi:hypothetical protein
MCPSVLSALLLPTLPLPVLLPLHFAMPLLVGSIFDLNHNQLSFSCSRVRLLTR